jgi:hypothetical protein
MAPPSGPAGILGFPLLRSSSLPYGQVGEDNDEPVDDLNGSLTPPWSTFFGLEKHENKANATSRWLFKRMPNASLHLHPPPFLSLSFPTKLATTDSDGLLVTVKSSIH